MEGTAAAPAPCWSGGGGSSSRTRRQRRCSRRDRESRCTRRRGSRPGDGSRRGLLSSSSSGSDSEGPSPPAPVAPGKGHSLQKHQQQRRRRRPLRRRKRPSGSSCSRDEEEEEEEEEDLIDGFAIASFVSLEALEKDATLKTPERLELRMKHSGKRKRGEGNNSDPEDEDGSSEKGRSRERAVRKRTKKRHKEPSLQSYLETGYICDTESDPEEQASVDDLEQSFTVSTSKASGPIGALNGSCEAKLSVIPKVSGLERSQERNYEADRDPLLVPFLPKEPPSQAAAAPAPAQALPPSPPAPPPTRTRAQTPNAVRGTPQPKGQLPPMPQGGAVPHNLTQSQLHMKVPPFASQTQAPYTVGLDLSTGGCSRGAAHPKPILPPCSPSSSQLPHRPSTPSLALPPHAFPPTLRPPSHHHPGMFTPSPGLPPPPPLLQVAGHPAAAAAISEQELIRQDLSSRFLTAQGGADMGAAAIRPLAFQFHQHNHQHQHTHQHTHQHFTPFPPGMVPTASPAMYEKYPGKMDGLLRHNFYAAFPPTVSGISPVLPPAVTFGSLQGAFQPKVKPPDIVDKWAFLFFLSWKGGSSRIQGSWVPPPQPPGGFLDSWGIYVKSWGEQSMWMRGARVTGEKWSPKAFEHEEQVLGLLGSSAGSGKEVGPRGASLVIRRACVCVCVCVCVRERERERERDVLHGLHGVAFSPRPEVDREAGSQSSSIAGLGSQDSMRKTEKAECKNGFLTSAKRIARFSVCLAEGSECGERRVILSSLSPLDPLFLPQSTNPDLPSRLGAVPPTLSQKGTQLTDPFRPTLRKPGKWCAMHVRVAYMILRHQEKMKVGWACAASPLRLRTVMGCGAAPAGSRQRVAASNGRSFSHSALLMSVLDPGSKAGSLVQGDPQKLDFRNDLLTGLPGTGAFGSLPHSQELARPATLFTASGAIHHPGSGTSFGPAGTPHGSFLSPSPHIGKSWRTRMPGPVGQDPASSVRLFTPLLASFPDPFGRPPSFASLGALSNGAFGGLGNPSFNSSAVFGQKDSPGAPAFPSPHEAWNRLHRTPPSFPTAPAWPKGGAGDGAERGGTQHEKESEKPEGPVIKDEKDRDALFSRHPLRASPATPTPKNLALTHEELPGRSHIPAEREHRYGSPAGSGHASRSPYPELPLKKEVKVKEEPELTGFEGALRTGPPFHSTLHVSHPLGTLAVFERPQAGTGGSVSPYLVAAPPSAASYAALEAWREPYHRGLELHPLQRLPRYLETSSPAATAAEDYERARLYGLAPPPHPSLMAYPRHPNGLLAKATPAAAAAAAAAAVGLLSAPPPLIPASNARPCSPRRAPDIRELAAYKDRDSR
ncbi:probable fibrosin-1 isoform X2 [Zootoca vivipara]|uniref:probable fibrosin-1 isoform X2 n=1 Tax=Zootoca vivipara TaxID=8524 RepID=UPI00293B95BB|nr:probable fibrosin-1 isoform X2 [Zootoca vivipara]